MEITGIATGGAGVARLPDGRVTFVHRTAPGDRVTVRVVEERGRWTRSRLVRVAEPGPGRRSPPCPHYERCGGCTLEHLDYGAQLEAKMRALGQHETQALSVLTFLRRFGRRLLVETFHRARPSAEAEPPRSAAFL